MGVPRSLLALNRYAHGVSRTALLLIRAVGETSTDLVGSGRGRRHPHRRDRSAPACGVARGPRAYRVRVPIMRVTYSAAIGRIASELISAMD